MNPARKTRSARRHRQTRRWIVISSVLVLIVAVLAVVFVWNPTQPSATKTPNEPEGFKVLANHYLLVMESLNSSTTKTSMAQQLSPEYNQTDLFAWEHSKLTFVQDPAGWFEDPLQILSSGKGICVQWSVVYISACLALSQPSRLVVAVDTSTWTFIHTWAEDYYNGGWVHVDPSDSVWNNPSRYLSWDWGKALGGQVRVYAFTDSAYVDVTSSYMSH